MKVYVCTKNTHVCIGVLIVIASNWKQLNCPSTDEQTMVYLHDRILPSNKKEWTTVRLHNMNESQTLCRVEARHKKSTYCIILFI